MLPTWIGYDYLLTVRQESRLFWKRKVTTASMLSQSLPRGLLLRGPRILSVSKFVVPSKLCRSQLTDFMYSTLIAGVREWE